MPANGTLTINIVYESCVVEIAGREFEIDLILLHIMHFYVILYMNCLIAYHVGVDYYYKKVVCNIPNKKHFSR